MALGANRFQIANLVLSPSPSPVAWAASFFPPLRLGFCLPASTELTGTIP
jgi:hypothetical protein